MQCSLSTDLFWGCDTQDKYGVMIGEDYPQPAKSNGHRRATNDSRWGNSNRGGSARGGQGKPRGRARSPAGKRGYVTARSTSGRKPRSEFDRFG